MQDGDRSGSLHLEHRSCPVNSADLSSAIKISIRGLDQTDGRVGTVPGSTITGKHVEDGVGSGTRNLENGAAVEDVSAVAPLVRSAVEVAVAAENQAAHGKPAIHRESAAAHNPAE